MLLKEVLVTESKIKVYGYRWLVLAVFMLVAVLNQLLWITFAPITGAAASFYGTTDLVIGLLSMVFMVVYIIIALPSAWVIDTWGFRAAVSIGGVLTALGALGRGIFAENFTIVFISQVVIAFGQPFILGSITKLAARWFSLEERGTASGLGTLSMYLGILLGMILTPVLTISYTMKGMLLVYGIAAALVVALFIILAREHPPTIPCPEGYNDRALMFDGLKSMLRNRNFILLLIIFFIGLGMFNGVTSWIEVIVRPRGFSISQAGMAGGLMLVGGVVGALVIPLISDKIRRRKPFIIMALAGLLPGLAGITFAQSYWLLLLSGFIFGFFLLSSGPIGFQYGAEITHPAPEGTSNSLLLVMGQISGIVFIFLMDALKSPQGSMTISLLGLIGLMILCVILSFFLRESPVHDATRR